MLCKPIAADWFRNKTSALINRAVLTLFDLLLRHQQIIYVPVCVLIHFSLLMYSKGENELGQIDMQHKVVACFGT